MDGAARGLEAGKPSVRSGPLSGLRIVEFAGIGPAPMTAMLLADLGADVIRIDRPEPSGLGVQKPDRFDTLRRSRRSVAIDLKHPEGVACALRLVDRADALVEGFRPGVMEKLGLGPDVCRARNGRLVYGRVTGWGQAGPLAQAAGHDLNYLALTGALGAIGRAGQPPTPPLNLVADFGGGALYLAFGIAAALVEAGRSSQGQVVDAAMVDGAASLMTMFYGLAAAGLHRPERGSNMLDGGAPFYDVYRCRDGRYVSVAPIEGKFRRDLLDRLGVDDAGRRLFESRETWPEARALLAGLFSGRDCDEWCGLLEGTDACFAPVLSMEEAPAHPHNRARGTYVEIDGIVQPGPAPRFDRTPAGRPTAPEPSGTSTRQALADWGFSPAELDDLHRSGAVGLRGKPDAGTPRVQDPARLVPEPA